MGGKRRYVSGSTVASVASTLKFVSCTKKGSKSTAKKTSTRPSARGKTSEVKEFKGEQVVAMKNDIVPVLNQATQKMAGTHKGTIRRPAEPVTMWFTVAIQEGKLKVLTSGEQLDCLQFIADFVEKNPDLRVDMYIASGFKVIGY